MASLSSPNRNLISRISPYKQTLHSSTDLKRLSLRRSHPVSLEFRLEDSPTITATSLHKIMKQISRRTHQLKNPPIKAATSTGTLTRHLRGLEVRPEDAAGYITQITKKFSRVKNFGILQEYDSFVPIRINKKVHAMRSLRNFTYDHEFCQDFMKCARYVNGLKIRKTSLDLAQLKKLQGLENLYLILKTKYLSLPEEDKKFTCELGKTLLKLPSAQNVTMEMEVDPEAHPFTFFELQRVLKDKVRVNLIADFVDVSNQRNKNITIEKILHTVTEYGIRDLKIKYVGLAQAVNRLGRSFYAPLHIKPELHMRFINAIMETSLEKVQFIPVVHSTYIDPYLKDSLISLMNAKPEIPKLTLVYNLDMIEPNNIDLFLDLYKQKVPSYEMTIISMNHLRKNILDKLEVHYASVLSRIQESKVGLSLQIIAKNINILTPLIRLLAAELKPSFMKSLAIQLTEPVDKNSLARLCELASSSGICLVAKEFEIDVNQKERPNSQDLYGFLSEIAKGGPKMHKMVLSYHNNGECEEVMKKTFEMLRSQYRWTQFEYELNVERKFYE